MKTAWPLLDCRNWTNWRAVLACRVILLKAIGVPRKTTSDGGNDTTAVSAVSRVEVFGFTRLTAADARAFAAMFLVLPQLPITDPILNLAVSIRQQMRLKTPDAIVAATALFHGLELITADSDFARVTGLVVVNPLSVQ